jgi:hypothetical protein
MFSNVAQIRSAHLRTLTSTNEENLTSTPPIEIEHVHNLYDTIATHFSQTRYVGWPQVDYHMLLLNLSNILISLCVNSKLKFRLFLTWIRYPLVALLLT